MSQIEFVTLASGGPLMTVECVEGANAVVVWLTCERRTSDGGAVMKKHRMMCPITSLRRLATVTAEELAAMARNHGLRQT